MKKKELEQLTVKQLKSLAEYHEIELKSNLKKAEIIKVILAKVPPEADVEEVALEEEKQEEQTFGSVPPAEMSVRVRRIYESLNKEQ